MTVNGTESTFEARTNRSVLGVGATAVVGTAGDETPDWDGDGRSMSRMGATSSLR